MAVLEKIRKQSVLLLVFIGVAMVAFVMGDLFSNQATGPAYDSIGEIWGEAIDVEEYEMRVQNEILRIEAQGLVADATQIRNQIWFQMTSEMILYREYDELGITVSSEELSDIIFGDNVHPEVMNLPIFQDTLTQQYSKQMAINVRNAVDTDPQLRSWWTNFEKYIKDLRRNEEYNNLIEKGIYATNAHAQFDYIANNRSVNYRMVVLKYADSPDSLVSFEEADVVAKFDEIKNRKQYEQVESRDIDYVEFIIEPTDEDRTYAQSMVNDQLIEDFKAAQNDSLFVMRKGDGKFFSAAYFKSGDFKGEADTLIFSGDSGEVVGPYYNEDNDSYDIAKILDIKYDTVATVRHILIGTDALDESSAEARADSVLNAIKRGADFEEMVTEYSDDPGSQQTGGKYEDFPRGQMVTEFDAFSFDEPIGALGVVKTQFGFHIIEVLERSMNKQVQLAIVDIQVKASDNTRRAVEELALTFALENRTPEAFELAAEEMGYSIKAAQRIIPDQFQQPIPGVQGDQTKLLKWMYEAEQGEISNRGILVGDRFIVAHVTQVREEGIPLLEDIRLILEPMVIKDKEAEFFAAQMVGSSIDELATTLGVLAQDNDGLKFSDNTIVGGGGNEPAVVGKIFAMADAGQIGVLSEPIVGEIGVYVIEVVSITEAPETTDYTMDKERLTTSWRSGLSTGNGFYQGPVYRALEEKAELKDYRAKVNLLRN